MRMLPRRVGATTLGTLAAFAGAFVLVHLLAPNWAHAVGLDVWEVQKEIAHRQQEDQRKRELEDEMNQLCRQIGASQVVIEALIEGRITFETAVEQIGQINEERPGFESVLETIYPSAGSRQECLCLYVLARVRSMVADEPERQAEVLHRLDDEHRELTRLR